MTVSMLKHFLLTLTFLSLAACATVTAEPDQEISVITTPPGATCALQNNDGTWTINPTPGSVRVKRSFSTLAIYCSASDGGSGSAMLEPQTRARAFGNLLMLGLPATVDAATGDGYEYKPAAATIALEGKSAF